MVARRIKLLYTAGAVIITSTAIILACGSDKTEAIVIDPPASIAPMIRITDDPESGGMPCVNPEQYERWLSEQKASEESIQEEVRSKPDPVDVEVSELDSGITETILAESTSAVLGSEINEPQTGEEELEGMVLESETDEVVPQTESHLGVQQESESASLQEPQVVETVAPGTPIYLCHGQLLSEELQEYGYNTCVAFGVEFYYPHLICQMYQESGFRQSAVSPYGDYGLMQLKGIYHDYFKQLAGIPWADLINDPYANIYCGVALVAHYWNQCHDLNTTISAYNTGSVTIYNSAYVAQVRQHESALQQIR